MKAKRLVALALSAAPLAGAQGSPPPVWSGEAGLSYVQTTGNSDTSTFGASARLLRQNDIWKLAFATAFIRDPVPGKKSTDNAVLASIVAKWPKPKPPVPMCPCPPAK